MIATFHTRSTQVRAGQRAGLRGRVPAPAPRREPPAPRYVGLVFGDWLALGMNMISPVLSFCHHSILCCVLFRHSALADPAIARRGRLRLNRQQPVWGEAIPAGAEGGGGGGSGLMGGTLDPNLPLLELFWRSLLPWNTVAPASAARGGVRR